MSLTRKAPLTKIGGGFGRQPLLQFLRRILDLSDSGLCLLYGPALRVVFRRQHRGDQRRPQPFGRSVDLGEMPRSVSRSRCPTCGNCAVDLSSIDFHFHRLPRPADRRRVGVYAFTELAMLFRHPKGVQPVFERG
jgi:hypothetical protein